MRRAIIATAIATLFVLPSTGVPAAVQEPLVVKGIFELTGPNAPSGNKEAEALALLQTVVNRQGGIRGRPLKIVTSDDQSDPRVAVQLATELIASGAPFFFGPGNSSTCNAVEPLVEKNGPLMICGSPGLTSPAGSYGIASGPSVEDVMLVNVRYFRARGWKRLGVLASTDGSGITLVRGFKYALSLPENKDVQAVALEYMNPTDISVAAQLAHIQAAKPDAILTLSNGAPWATIMRGVNDAGVKLPIAGGSGNLIFKQLAQFHAFLPRELYFPGLISLRSDVVGPGPIRDAQKVYFRAFQEIGVQPDSGALPWDSGMIVVGALRALGPTATAQQMRDYFMKLHSWAGINGIYDFRDGSQRGLGARSLEMYRYDNETRDVIPVSRPGGYLR